MPFRSFWQVAMSGMLLLVTACVLIPTAPYEPSPPSSPLMTYVEKAQEAHRLEQFGTAEEYYLKAQKEGEETKNWGFKQSPSWCFKELLARIYYAQGKYDKAIRAMQVYLDNRDREFAARHGEIGPQFRWLGGAYQAWGKCDEALKCFERGRKEGEEFARSQGGSMDAYNAGTNARANADYMGRYRLERGEYEEAKEYFQEVLDYFLRNHLDRADHEGRARMQLGVACYYAGDEATAADLLGQTVGLDAAAFVVVAWHLPEAAGALARIEEHRSAGAKALEVYESVVNALHGSPCFRTETADVLNQLGGFQLRQGRLAEAKAAYKEAMRLRVATQTATHPSYADSLKGLADVCASRDQLTSATRLAKHALAVLDASVVPTHPRTAQTLVALQALYTLTGHPEQATPLRQRLDTILQQPLGIWKEDFVLTLDFYAGLLQKAGKAADAKRLRDLYSRQRPRK